MAFVGLQQTQARVFSEQGLSFFFDNNINK